MNNDLKKRIVNLSYAYKESHLSSCLTAVDIIDTIYFLKGTDPFVLDNAHAAMALYAVIEKYENKSAEKLFQIHGVHQNRDLDNGIYVSGGSLGLAGSIALGASEARKPEKVWCLTSDGALAEGIWWETLRIAAERKLDNFKLAVNANGYSAMKETDIDSLITKFQAFGWGVYKARTIKELTQGLTISIPNTPIVTFYLSNMEGYPKFLQGVNGHYQTLDTEEKYREVIDCL